MQLLHQKHFYNGDSITYPDNHCSMQTIASIQESKEYSVVVHLYLNTNIGSLTKDKRRFTVAIEDMLLIICPPLWVEPAEVEGGGRSTSSVSAQGDAEQSSSETSDSECSCWLSITDYSQVDPECPTG